MTGATLFERVVEERLRHALYLEQHMVRLLRRLDAEPQDEQTLRARYEWYASAAKALATKDLLGFSKLYAAKPQEEDAFVGFEDD